MEEVHVRMNENGRIVIPAAMRSALGVGPGDEMVLRIKDGELHITTVRNRIAHAQQLVSRYSRRGGARLSDELIAERRATAKHE